MTDTDQYRENWISLMHQVMGQQHMSMTAFAEWMGIGRITVHKINQRAQLPTVKHAIDLCRRTGVDANWMFLNEGSMGKVTIAPLPLKAAPGAS